MGATATFNEVRAGYQPSDTLVLDRNGDVLHRLRTDATVRRGQWVALADISPALRTALVLSEDKRFYEHSGVDWRAVSAAAWGCAVSLAGASPWGSGAAAGATAGPAESGACANATKGQASSWRARILMQSLSIKPPSCGRSGAGSAHSRAIWRTNGEPIQTPPFLM